MTKPVLHEISDDKKKLLVFHCPGCGYGHPYEVPRWSWNGDMVRPSFTPSLLCNPFSPEHRCHLFVTDGRIHYCSDCHHKLAGQVVDMVPWNEDDA